MKNTNFPSQKQSFLSHPLVQAFLKRILFVKKETKSDKFVFECLLYVVLVIWGLSFFDENNFAKNRLGASDSFLHNINLIFHEAGHLIFSPFGRFMHIFGGTLMQCLIPLIIMIQFLRQRDNFEASIGLWWFGQNFLDVAPYIYDAWDRKLILLGGHTGQEHPGGHDWYNLLKMTESLESYAEIASFAANSGILLMLLSFVWGGVVLYKKFLILQADKLNAYYR